MVNDQIGFAIESETMKNSLNLCLVILLLVVLGCTCPKLGDLGKKDDPISGPHSFWVHFWFGFVSGGLGGAYWG